MSEYVIAKYLRLSLDDNVTDSLSIPSQHLLLDEHIESLDIPNAKVLEFVDNGFTGTNLDRPAMQEMLDLVGAGKVNCIITKDLSRFSRSNIESGYYIEQVFPLYSIRFIAVSDGFDSANYKNSTGGIVVAFKQLMHEYYSRDLSKKVKSAKRVQMQSGENIVANAIYGYRKNDLGKWEPDPKAADVVKQIFSMALEGFPTACIRDRLCTARYPTPREYIDIVRHGKDIQAQCVWTARMVLSILTNVQYTGAYVSGKQESKAVGSSSKIHVDKSKWIVIPDRHPPIISKEVFAAIQDIRSRFKSSTTAKPVENLLKDENRSKRARMVSGQWIAATPIFGYSKMECGKWGIDGSAASVVQEIFDMALRGLTCTEICVKLSSAGYPTLSEYIKSAKGQNILPTCQWKSKSVRSILQNIQYTGAFVSGKILKDYASGKSFHTAKSDWIVIPDKHPAIISKEVFDRVQEVMAKSRCRRKNMGVRYYLLRGDIVKCSGCGYALMYDDSSDEVVYRCNHMLSVYDAGCHKMKVNAAELDDAILAIIKKQAEVVLKTTDLSGIRKVSAGARRVDECEKQIYRLVEQIQTCYERFIGQEIDREAYLSLKADCTAQIDRLNNQLAILRQAERDKDAGKKAAAMAKEVLSESASPKDIVNTLVDKIFVSPDDSLEIRWKFASFVVEH